MIPLTLRPLSFIEATLAGAFCFGVGSAIFLATFRGILHYPPLSHPLIIAGFACIGAGMFGISEEHLKKYKKEGAKI